MSEAKFTLGLQSEADLAAVERLTERAFGPGRFARSAYRLREGRNDDAGLSYVARAGTLLVGANRMTTIRIGNTPALILGPLVVEPAFRQLGLGEALVQKSLDAARDKGHRLVILVGDEAYYGRMGFQRVPDGRIDMPGPVDPERLLYCELTAAAFDGVTGAVAGAD